MTDSNRLNPKEATGSGPQGTERGPGAAEVPSSEAGLRMSDLLELPDPLRQTVSWMLHKREISLADLSAHLQQDETSARSLLAEMVDRGYLWETRVQGETRYRLRLAPQPKRKSRVLDF